MDPEVKLVCTVCDGTEFYTESGFYFCSECQTQTQEHREQVYEYQGTTERITKVKKTIQKEKSFVATNKPKLTSWETYNYILCGLVKELIALGSNKELKDVTHNLWLRYLMKLEIISSRTENDPKFGAVYKKRDAELVFQRSFKKKRSKKTDSGLSPRTNTTEKDSKALSRERAKEKRALMRADYEEYSNTQPSTSLSLCNQTLTSLTNTEDTQSQAEIKFSKAARKELKRCMNAKHLKQHAGDFANKLHCHKITTKQLSFSYHTGPLILTKSKLYSLIYISMLLTRDTVQLSDMLRYCREGSLSYMEYRHFFPEEFTLADINEKVYTAGIKVMVGYNCIRKSAYDIMKLLKINQTDLKPDLLGLCRKYCTELNLPDQIYQIAGNLISATNPRLLITDSIHLMPNYEGRVMAFILYTMKLLLSLDDSTEFELSKYASKFNSKSKKKSKLFVFTDWYNFIEYRKLLLKKTHFPTQFLLDPESQNIGPYTRFLEQRKSAYNLDELPSILMTAAKKCINDLLLFQNNPIDLTIKFETSTTLFRDHFDTLIKSENLKNYPFEINTEIIRQFATDNIEFLFDTNKYLDPNYQVINGRANTEENFIKLTKSRNKTKDKAALEAEWNDAFNEEKLEKFGVEIQKENDATIQNKLKMYFESPLVVQNEEFKRKLNLNLSQSNKKQKKVDQSELFFIPRHEYWVNLKNIIHLKHNSDWAEFQKTLPDNFLWLLEECARTIEHKPKDLFEEFMNVELYVNYVHFEMRPVYNRSYQNYYEILDLVKNAKKNW